MATCKIEKRKRKCMLVKPPQRGRRLTAAEKERATREVMAEAARCLGTRTCDSCDVCSLLCPDLCITRDPVSGKVVIDYEYCKGCGICAFVCPKGAITMVLEEGDFQYKWQATE